MALNETTEANFENDVLNAPDTVVVDFFAPWCGPCKVIAPILDELSKEMSDVRFFKVNVDDNLQLAQQYNISGVPTMLVFRKGEVVNSKVGAGNKEDIKNFVMG